MNQPIMPEFTLAGVDNPSPRDDLKKVNTERNGVVQTDVGLVEQTVHTFATGSETKNLDVQPEVRENQLPVEKPRVNPDVFTKSTDVAAPVTAVDPAGTLRRIQQSMVVTDHSVPIDGSLILDPKTGKTMPKPPAPTQVLAGFDINSLDGKQQAAPLVISMDKPARKQEDIG